MESGPARLSGQARREGSNSERRLGLSRTSWEKCRRYDGRETMVKDEGSKFWLESEDRSDRRPNRRRPGPPRVADLDPRLGRSLSALGYSLS